MMYKLTLLVLLLGSALSLPVYHHRARHPGRLIDPIPPLMAASTEEAEVPKSVPKVEKAKSLKLSLLGRTLGRYGIDMNSFENYF